MLFLSKQLETYLIQQDYDYFKIIQYGIDDGLLQDKIYMFRSANKASVDRLKVEFIGYG